MNVEEVKGRARTEVQSLVGAFDVLLGERKKSEFKYLWRFDGRTNTAK